MIDYFMVLEIRTLVVIVNVINSKTHLQSVILGSKGPWTAEKLIWMTCRAENRKPDGGSLGELIVHIPSVMTCVLLKDQP